MNAVYQLVKKAAVPITGLAACMILMTPDAAMAQLPPGKRSVSGPELVEIVKEDFIKRKYLVTGNLTKEVSNIMRVTGGKKLRSYVKPLKSF